MKKINVLITAASRRVPLVRAFRDAVAKFGKGRVITTDISPLSPALYFGHKHHIVPLTTDRNYIPIIEGICGLEDINLVIPTIDDELPVFGSLRERFESLGVRVSASSEEIGLICNDKYRMFLYCRDNGIPVPPTVLAAQIDEAIHRFPTIVKPRFGRGSVNVYHVQTEEQLRMFAQYVPDSIIQEYVEGTEFTVDVLSNFSGKVISVVPRERLVIRAGVTDKGITRKNPQVMEFAVEIAERLQLVGASNIQCKWDGQKLTLIEINPRFSGGIPLTLAAGADFPSWLLQMTAGMDVRSQLGKFQDGLAMMSFEESIFAKESELLVHEGDKARMLSRMRQVSGLVN